MEAEGRTARRVLQQYHRAGSAGQKAKFTNVVLE